MMLNSPSLNHAKVLLHLKWFVNRLVKSFEQKIQAAGSLERSQTADYNTSYSVWNSKNTINSVTSPLSSPLAKGWNGMNLKNRSLSNDGDRFSSDDQSPTFERGLLRQRKFFSSSNQNKSPKVRSLTNSPFMIRLPLRRILSSKRIPLSEHSDSNSDLEKGPLNSFPGLHLSELSDESLSQLDSKDPQFPPFRDMDQLRILCILKGTSELDRKTSIIKFAQQLCVVYEYQIGFLQGLKAVHSAADYIAELLIKAIRIGRITSLSPNDLTLKLLHDVTCRPSSQTKCVKTSPMTGTGEQLSWRLGDIWTRPGLRHNEVGGENCHNLNIVTHFLAPCSPELETKRPDIYGYRNLIVLPSRGSPTVVSSDGIYENTTSDEATVYANGNSDSPSHPQSFDIFPSDEDTIIVSNIRTGSRLQSPQSKVQRLDSITSSPIRREDVLKRHQATKTKSPLLSTSVNLRQHLHRAYRPVFFVIYERPSVIDHLTECESFAAFCKRQNICPVMFLNQETDLFSGRTCPNLFQHFDIFCLTTNGYVSKTGREGQSSQNAPQPPLLMPNSSREAARPPRSTNDLCLSGIDNPGFIC